jgi:DNA topoisomerase-2
LISISKQANNTQISLVYSCFYREKGEIKICNDGRGIPVRKWAQDESIYIPTLIFGKLLTSDNFNDDQKRITGIIFPNSFLYFIVFSFQGGRNGYGAKVTNIFSKKFTVETCSKEFKKLFKQVISSLFTHC